MTDDIVGKVNLNYKIAVDVVGKITRKYEIGSDLLGKKHFSLCASETQSIDM